MSPLPTYLMDVNSPASSLHFNDINFVMCFLRTEKNYSKFVINKKSANKIEKC